MGAIGRSIGSFGDQVGQGYDINQQWQQRAQQMALENARQKIANLMAPLQLQELQQRIRQMGQPQAAGTTPLPGGGLGGLTFDPSAGKYQMQPLVSPTMTPANVGQQILSGRSKLSESDQAYADSLLGELRMGADPSKVLDKWQSFFAGASKAQKQKPPVVDANKGTVTTYDVFGNATELPIYDEKGGISKNLPPELQPLVASQVSAITAKDKQRQADQEAESQRVLDRMMAGEDYRTAQADKKQKMVDATKAVTEAINAFKNYQTQSAGAQKIGMASHWYEPGTWGQESAAQPRVDEALEDAEGKRQDAIQKLRDAGMPVPNWLNKPLGGSSSSPTDLPGVTPIG